MASSKIKGITIEIGGETTKLGKALEEVEKSSKNLQSELKGVNTLLKMDPGNVELLKQKQELLTQSIEATESKLGTLKNTMAQIESGEIEVTAEQFRDLQREIIYTEQKLNNLTDESKEFGSVTQQQSKIVVEEFQTIGDKAGELGKNLALGLAGAVTGAVASVEATREFRQDLGKLETTFETTNHGAETATNTFKTLYGILGEDDTAIEAANHLALMTDNEKELEEWTDILTGVYATFGDSLPLEGLAEAANETARVGQVTGPLADALNWLSISEDQFNESLAKCNSEQERNKLIRDTLTKAYGEASDTYKEVNGDVIEGNEAQAEMNLKLAEITSKLEPLITQCKIFLAEVLEKLSPIITWIIDNISILAPIVLGFLGTLFALNIAGKITALIPIIKTLNTTMKANPIGLVITLVGLLVTAFVTLWNNCEGFRNFWIGLWDNIKAIVAAVVEWLKNALISVAGFFTDLWSNIKKVFSVVGTWFKDIFSKAWTGIKNVFSPVASFFSGIWNGIKNAFGKVTSWFKDTFSKAWTAVKNVFSTGGKIFSGIKEGIESTFKTVVNGIISGINKVIKVPFDAINGMLNKIRNISVAGVEPFKSLWKKNPLSVPQIPKLKVGTDFVPSDNMLAYLHKGEQVVPAKYNPAANNEYMKDAMFDALTDFTNVRSQGNSEIATLNSLMNKYMPEIIAAIPSVVALDGKKVVGELIPEIDSQLGILATKRKRGV